MLDLGNSGSLLYSRGTCVTGAPCRSAFSFRALFLPYLSTFLGTEMPPIERYSPGAICLQLGGSCSKLAYWLQVRGTMCSEPEWKPQFNGKLSEASENAAYSAALDRQNVCVHQAKENEEYTEAIRSSESLRVSGLLVVVVVVLI